MEEQRARLQLYNTMSRSKQPFTTRSAKPNTVQMYVCGVTVYDFSHIGKGIARGDGVGRAHLSVGFRDMCSEVGGRGCSFGQEADNRGPTWVMKRRPG